MQIGCAGSSDHEVISEDGGADEVHARQERLVVLRQAGNHRLCEPGSESVTVFTLICSKMLALTTNKHHLTSSHIKEMRASPRRLQA